MNNVLIVSFDIIDKDEAKTSLAVGYLLSYLKSYPDLCNDFRIYHKSVNMMLNPFVDIDELSRTILTKYNPKYLVIGCYVWCERYINPLLAALRNHGFNGLTILGGYQLNNVTNLDEIYPEADVFIRGYAEESLKVAIISNVVGQKNIIDLEPIMSKIPSPYLKGEICLSPEVRKARIESKRGCLYKCIYCAHTDLNRHKIYFHELDKVKSEIQFLAKHKVSKINFIDPIFNYGNNYLDILDYCCSIGLTSKLSVQSKFDLINDNEIDFLNYIQKLNATIEFGVQTTNSDQLKTLGRKQDIQNCIRVMNLLTTRSIDFEVTLIYGIPGQTLKSFEADISLLENSGCRKINAFPLAVLRGTKLWCEQSQLKIKVEEVGDYRIPVVVETESFKKDEWQKMVEIADKLSRRGKSNA